MTLPNSSAPLLRRHDADYAPAATHILSTLLQELGPLPDRISRIFRIRGIEGSHALVSMIDLDPAVLELDLLLSPGEPVPDRTVLLSQQRCEMLILPDGISAEAVQLTACRHAVPGTYLVVKLIQTVQDTWPRVIHAFEFETDEGQTRLYMPDNDLYYKPAADNHYTLAASNVLWAVLRRMAVDSGLIARMQVDLLYQRGEG